MLRYLADENLNNHVVRALRLRDSKIDIVTVQEVGLGGADDPTVLAWAAEQGRIVVTHDVATMTRHAYDRVDAGQPMPGVIEVLPETEIGVVVADLALLAHASSDDEWEGVVLYLPLR